MRRRSCATGSVLLPACLPGSSLCVRATALVLPARVPGASAALSAPRRRSLRPGVLRNRQQGARSGRDPVPMLQTLCRSLPQLARPSCLPCCRLCRAHDERCQQLRARPASRPVAEGSSSSAAVASHGHLVPASAAALVVSCARWWRPSLPGARRHGRASDSQALVSGGMRAAAGGAMGVGGCGMGGRSGMLNASACPAMQRLLQLTTASALAASFLPALLCSWRGAVGRRAGCMLSS